MIVLDIETSGFDTGRCGIWQIGALEFENPDNSFLDECRLDSEDKIEEGALIVTGKTREDLLDAKKQAQKSLVSGFLDWARGIPEKIYAGHNVGWDLSFIQNRCFKYGLEKKSGEAIGQSARVFDLHTIAQNDYARKKGHFYLKPDGTSAMSLPEVLKYCGIKDPRIQLNGTEVVKQGTAHSALEDVRLEAECFSRILYGRVLFPEYAQFEIPKYLQVKVEAK